MSFQDNQDPAKYLTEPQSKPDTVLGQPYGNPTGIFDAMSPSWWINEAIKIFIGKDILGTASEFFAGDWDKVYQYGDALSKAGDAALAVGINISWGNHQADQSWDGNAADAAAAYFAKVSAAHSDLNNVLKQLSSQYEQAAASTWRAADTVGGLIRIVLDRLFWAGITAGAGTLLSGGTATAAGYGAAALMIKDAVATWEKASKIMAVAGTTLNGIVAEMQGLTGNAGALERLPLPETGYKHHSQT